MENIIIEKATLKDKETRYYIDLDLKNNKILKIDYDQRENIVQELSNSLHQRVFITKGQYNKLIKKGGGINYGK